MIGMQATQKLFYDRPELFSCEAELLALEGEPAAPVLVLDRTIFYPEGGGQSCDLGTIARAVGATSDGGRAASVASVSESGGVVLHRLAVSCDFRAGERVRLLVDRERRIDYSQQHTAEHLLGSIALRLLGAHVVSVHFGSERSLIDFDSPSISDEDLAALEDEAERIIADDYPVRYHVCPPEDLGSFPLRRKAPELEGEELRVVEIDGIDYSACCGLHQTSTGKLRALRILGAEKYKGMSRVYFVAGARAASDYRAVSRIARDAARTLGTSEAQLAEAVAREAERLKELEFKLVALERERAAAEVAAALEELAREGDRGSAAAPSAARRLVARRYADRDSASLMPTAKAFAEAGFTALLASLPELTAQALAPAADARLGERLKACLSSSGGKGGGGPSNFRAVFSDREGLERFMSGAEALLRTE